MFRILVITLSLLLIVGAWFVRAPEDKVVFLDVGQGDSILLQDGTKQVLIDGGQGMTILRRLGEELPWFDRRIDVVVATHPDRDHLEGLVHVIERYEVGLVLLPQMPHTSQLQSAWLEELQKLLESRKIAYRFGWQGQHLKVSDELQVQLLGPFAEKGMIFAPGGKTNNAAILARADFADLSLLLTADAEASIEKRLTGAYNGQDILNVDILKAGHHGSKTSTTPALLAAASPSAVVISVGQDNRYGHPHPTVLGRLAEVDLWRTDEAGSVRFVRQGDEWLAPAR